MKIFELFDAEPITEAGLQIFGRSKGGKAIKKKLNAMGDLLCPFRGKEVGVENKYREDFGRFG